MDLHQRHKCLLSLSALLEVGLLDGIQAWDCNRQVQEMLHKAYFNPRAAQGAEREINRTLESPACSCVTMRKIVEERARAVPAANNLFICTRQVPASLVGQNSKQSLSGLLKLVSWSTSCTPTTDVIQSRNEVQTTTSYWTLKQAPLGHHHHLEKWCFRYCNSYCFKISHKSRYLLCFVMCQISQNYWEIWAIASSQLLCFLVVLSFLLLFGSLGREFCCCEFFVWLGFFVLFCCVCCFFLVQFASLF